jgi:hypothetical protein
MPPRRNTRPADNPQPLPRPGFQTVLNSLLAQRDAALGVRTPSQPIARWESSSQPEILWELLTERRRAGIPPTLSQEQDAALEAALAHIPNTTVNDTIIEMETAVAQSQSASPPLTVVSDAFWDAIQLALPASGIPAIVTQGSAFQEARLSSQSAASSPMDTSSNGILAPAPHSPSLITPLPAAGDIPEAPIVLSSDSAPSPLPVPEPTRGEHEAGKFTDHAAASPPPAGVEKATTPSAISSIEGSDPSNVTPLDSVSSWGRDADHPLELSSDSPAHSSLRESEIPDVPDMGSARRGGKMTSGKATDEFENASPAVLARARYLGVVPARDTKASTALDAGRLSARDTLHKFATTNLNDGSVFTYANMDTACEEATTTLHDSTEELNNVRLGFAHYYLDSPITLVDDPSVPVESEFLRKMADIVGAVLCGGPSDTSESEGDIYASILPGEWFRLATFMTAAIARGCIRTKNLTKKGAFPVEPCKDTFITDPSVTAPATQAKLLQALAVQVAEELNPDGALMPQDSVDGLRATIWRAHEGQIRAWAEKEVLSVYSRLSDICLSDILDKLEADATVEQISEIMRDEIAMETWGKFQGLIAQEKTKAYNAAIEEARASALREALTTGAAEAANKGKAYREMILSRAEEEARVEGDRVYKSRLESLRTKMKRKAESEVEAEHAAVVTERRTALESALLAMEFNARKDYVRTQAIQLGLLDDSATPVPSPPKRAKVGNAPRTTPKASPAPSAVKSGSLSVPSSCPAAEKDDSYGPRAPTAPVDWSMSEPGDPLPPIDFDADTRASSASVHAPGNSMEIDPPAPGAVSSLRDPDSGCIPLSNSNTSTSAPSKVLHSNHDTTATATPPSEVKQRFDLIVSKMAPLEREVARIANIVDGKARPTTQPRAKATAGPSHRTTPLTPSPPCIDDDEVSFPALGPVSKGQVASNDNWSYVSAGAGPGGLQLRA